MQLLLLQIGEKLVEQDPDFLWFLPKKTGLKFYRVLGAIGQFCTESHLICLSAKPGNKWILFDQFWSSFITRTTALTTLCIFQRLCPINLSTPHWH